MPRGMFHHVRKHTENQVRRTKNPQLFWRWVRPKKHLGFTPTPRMTVAKGRLRLGFPTKNVSCHPGDDWHPGKAVASKTYQTSDQNCLLLDPGKS